MLYVYKHRYKHIFIAVEGDSLDQAISKLNSDAYAYRLFSIAKIDFDGYQFTRSQLMFAPPLYWASGINWKAWQDFYRRVNLAVTTGKIKPMEGTLIIEESDLTRAKELLELYIKANLNMKIREALDVLPLAIEEMNKTKHYALRSKDSDLKQCINLLATIIFEMHRTVIPPNPGNDFDDLSKLKEQHKAMRTRLQSNYELLFDLLENSARLTKDQDQAVRKAMLETAELIKQTKI